MEGSEGSASSSGSPPVNSVAWLDALLRQKCGVPSLHPHQLAHGKDLVDGRELVLVLKTGGGKSIILSAALLAAHARSSVPNHSQQY